MKKTIEYHGHKYILASSFSSAEKLRVLKENDSFAVFDRFGDISNVPKGDEGVYHLGTRHLSQLELSFASKHPILMNSNLNDKNTLLSIELSNPEFEDYQQKKISPYSIYLNRSICLQNATLYEKLSLTNHLREPVSFPLYVRLDADFVDIFEIRGFKRKRRGESRLKKSKKEICFSYTGLDKVLRKTIIKTQPAPTNVQENALEFWISLKPRLSTEILLKYDFWTNATESFTDNSTIKARSFSEVIKKIQFDTKKKEAFQCNIETSDPQFNRWIERSRSDLNTMVSRTKWGRYPYAGIPWFSAPFGRDGIITAIQCLWLDPKLARDTLLFLSQTQSQEASKESDSQPGKIIHEMRSGEMAKLGEVPFGKYYGSVDATPLFICLADLYFSSTGDLPLIRKIWPHIEAALHWIDVYGDSDKDGFIEYQRQGEDGLQNQAWKDSDDSVFHKDGSLAMGPLALCEVQAYTYAAKRGAARLATSLGLDDLCRRLEWQAQNLREIFNRSFWISKIGTYSIALDRNKRPCEVRSSNAGHCLAFEIAQNDYANKIASGLLEKNFFTGWGVRTLDQREARFNPMSYHNGSVWPHDNSIIAWGLSKYGEKEKVLKITESLFALSTHLEFYRLPELICGFPRQDCEGPALYPLSCAPQSWAAGAVFLCIQSCLGLEIFALKNEVHFRQPQLPSPLNYIEIHNLKVGSKQTVDLRIESKGTTTKVKVLRKSDGARIKVFD